jgi:hypothetical protein
MPELMPRTDTELNEIDSIELRHRRLAQTNPILAAHYYAANSHVIDEARNRQQIGRKPLFPEVQPHRIPSLDEVLFRAGQAGKTGK